MNGKRKVTFSFGSSYSDFVCDYDTGKKSWSFDTRTLTPSTLMRFTTIIKSKSWSHKPDLGRDWDGYYDLEHFDAVPEGEGDDEAKRVLLWFLHAMPEEYTLEEARS